MSPKLKYFGIIYQYIQIFIILKKNVIIFEE